MQERHPSSLIYRLNHIVSRHLSQNTPEDCADLSYTNARIIHFIASEATRNIYQKDVEKEFGITRSTASRVLMLMERKGLVTRHSVKHDARLKKLVLTEKAQHINDILQKQSHLLDEIMLRGFSDEEAKQLQSYIARITNNVIEETLG